MAINITRASNGTVTFDFGAGVDPIVLTDSNNIIVSSEETKNSNGDIIRQDISFKREHPYFFLPLTWAQIGTINGAAKPAIGDPTTQLLESDVFQGSPPFGTPVPANPTGVVGLTAVNGVAATYMRSDAAPALDPTILTQTGEANKIPQLDNGGTLVLENATQRAEYGPASVFIYGPNASWMDLDASGMEIDLIAGGKTIHIGMDGIDAVDQPITSSHVPAQPNELINKAYLDAQIAAIPDGLNYKGSWNPVTNVPVLADGTGANGDMYKVSAAGSRDLGSGAIVFEVGDHVVYVTGTDNKWENFGQSAPVPANPTATVGIAAKPGTSPNFMRSDAAPAIDQAIVPTWTGAHTFTAAMTVNSIAASGTITSSAGVAGNTTVTAGIGSNSVQMDGAPNGSDTVIRALGVTDANVSIQFQAKGTGLLKLASPTTVTGSFNATGAATFGGNVAVAGLLGSANNTTMPSATNSGITLGGAPTWAMQSFYDQSNTANNRTADLLFISNSIKFRFVNDARNAFLDVLSINGGQALGVTGITSTSGSGNWAHTGGFTTTGAVQVSTGTDGNKLWLSKYTSGTGHNNAPTAIGATSTYLQVGGREYGNNGFGGIGFSYVSAPTDNPAVWIGWEEKNTTGSTNGDFIIATRPTTTNVAPTERMRITATGDATFTNNVNVTGTLASTAPAVLSSGYTIATLPAASTALRGARAYVTNGSAPTFMGAVGATGSVVAPVFCNGTAWVYA